jgi:hypothetical protein
MPAARACLSGNADRRAIEHPTAPQARRPCPPAGCDCRDCCETCAPRRQAYGLSRKARPVVDLVRNAPSILEDTGDTRQRRIAARRGKCHHCLGCPLRHQPQAFDVGPSRECVVAAVTEMVEFRAKVTVGNRFVGKAVAWQLAEGAWMSPCRGQCAIFLGRA